ncbi:hypothetical protein AFCDBAGC_0082 [Methylobacterium cerastii]|uniref:Uncharacterized protein n=1 Tax=Methylobacterium cerastii TaxID=932741 RepID=A0ABQ4QBH1_9HYPH|nr:hypothetical protein [Methylobacterium cerastii]GJD42247.1 hypothetical protein AFCDBAGC_0082 [Methylobacterium cerastii]
MTMSVHDALDAWSEGRISLERAYALTGAESVGELLTWCDSCDVERPHPDAASLLASLAAPGEERLAEIRRREAAFDAALRRARIRDPGLSDDAYDPASIRVLAELGPLPRRPTGHVEDVPDPAWLALSPEDRADVMQREANPEGLATFDPMAHPAYATAVQAISDRRRDAAGRPRMDGARLVSQVILAEDGRLFVEAPGSPPTRIVAIPAKRAAAVGQRVAELVAEALAARARAGEGTA